MKTIFALTTVFLSLAWFTQSVAEVGYKNTPWGSKTWTGPGTPPHWSPQPKRPHRPVDPEWGGKPPHHKPIMRSRGYFYYERPRTETVIIEQQIPVQVAQPPAQRVLSPLRCGGETLTRKDPVTGELIIEYVTGSQNCSQ